MELLEKCKILYDELVILHDELAEIEKQLKENISDIEFEDLYKKEFEYSILLIGCYEDLMYALEKLERERVGMDFYITRVRQNASKIMNGGPIYVNY